jgi:hypothetical protein
MHIATKSLNNITPYEAYCGRKHDVSHLCEIGCCAFVLILNKHNPKIFHHSEEHVLIGYGKDSKTYHCYHRATHKVVESYHVVFIESKDECETPLRPGVTQGLDDESENPPNTITAAPNPPPTAGHQPSSNPNPNPGVPSIQSTPILPPISSTSISSHMWRSSRLPKPSSRSAEASGINQLSTVQCATAESITSKPCLDEQKQSQRHSWAISQGGTLPNNSPALPNPEDLVEIAYKAANKLSEAQTASILEQLYSEGFKWGQSADIDVTTSPEEPCSLAEALVSPDAPKWLAACNEEFASIKDLKVVLLVPRNTATGRTIMDGKFVFRLKRDQNENPVWWKAHFVIKGYSAIYGIDYNETTAPTMQMETFRTVAQVAAVNNWVLHQVDIKTVCLRGAIKPGKKVYMKQPNGFEAKGQEDCIWEPQKGLYGHESGND